MAVGAVEEGGVVMEGEALGGVAEGAAQEESTPRRRGWRGEHWSGRKSS